MNGSGNYSVQGSRTWLINLYEPLLEIGHEVYLVDLEKLSRQWNIKFRTDKFRERLSEYLPKLFFEVHKNNPFDLIFSYLTDLDIHSTALKEIKRHGLPMLNFSCNNTHQFHLVENTALYYDYNLHAEKDAGEKFRRTGANPVWFQMSANPNYFFPLEQSKKFDISFIGSNYGSRGDYLEYLLSRGLNVHAFGPNWLINRPYPGLKRLYKGLTKLRYQAIMMTIHDPDNRIAIESSLNELKTQQTLRRNFRGFMHYPIPDSELNPTYNRSRINLGFLEVIDRVSEKTPTLKSHLHLREFEIPMSGGLYITNYSDELAEHYVPDREVLVFRDEHELFDKCRYYLANPELAARIAREGHERALKSHTSQKRLEALFAQIKL